MKISYFVTPHGFGHASRSAAVMAAIAKIDSDASFQIVTTVPQFVFQTSGLHRFQYEPIECDVGLVQRTPTEEDLEATVSRLDNFLRFLQLERTISAVTQFCPDFIVCDISALGLVVGKKTGIPTVLVENFTWDWIYEGYLAREPRLADAIDTFRTLYATPDFRIQLQPVCSPRTGAHQVAPISRALRAGWSRPALIAAHERYILISMGGVAGTYPFLEQLAQHQNYVFVVAGDKTERTGNVVRFANADDSFYHPNLVADAELVISKAGASTVSEVYWAGVPFVAITRPQFRESAVICDFISSFNPTLSLSQEQFYAGDWLGSLADIMKPAVPRIGVNGAEQAASILAQIRDAVIS